MGTTSFPRPSPIFPTFEGVAVNRLATSADIVELQKRANAEQARLEREASWKALTVRAAVRDAREAIFGITADLYGNTPHASLWEVSTRNNRLRGIGVLLVVLAGSWLVVDSVM